MVAPSLNYGYLIYDSLKFWFLLIHVLCNFQTWRPATFIGQKDCTINNLACVPQFFVLGANLLLKYKTPNFENETPKNVW